MNFNIVQVALLGIGICLVAIASLFSIICVATDSWITFELSDIRGNLGLWRYCEKVEDEQNVCEEFKS